MTRTNPPQGGQTKVTETTAKQKMKTGKMKTTTMIKDKKITATGIG